MTSSPQTKQDSRPTIRSFVSVELPSEIRDLLESRQSDLRTAMGRAAQSVRWTRPDSVHLTLQFLGDIPSSSTSQIATAIAEACSHARPLILSLGHTGAFPNLNRPRVIWIGLEGDIDPLRALAASISHHLKPLGFKPDKPFQPHITLARIRETARPDELHAISHTLTSTTNLPTPSPPFTAQSVSLMQSHLQPGGSVYTQLANIPFHSTP
jgi:2'-5' RNA ligase